MGFSREQFCKWIALWRGLHLFVLFPCYQVQDFISHVTEPLVEMNSLTKAHTHTHTHLPWALFGFSICLLILFLESPQAVQTWPFTTRASIALSPLHHWPYKSGFSFVPASWLPLVARLTPRLQNPFPSGNNFWKRANVWIAGSL